MQVNAVVDEVGAFAVLDLLDDPAVLGTPIGQELARALPLGLPTGGHPLVSRLAALVERAAVDLFPEFRRLILAGPELAVFEAVAAVSPTLPAVVALPASTSPEVADRIAANMPPGLDIEDVITVPMLPPGDVKAADTLIIVAGFSAGPNMWSIPSAARSVMDFYRGHLMYDALLLDPLGLPVYQRTRLFSVVSDVAVDHVMRPCGAFQTIGV